MPAAPASTGTLEIHSGPEAEAESPSLQKPDLKGPSLLCKALFLASARTPGHIRPSLVLPMAGYMSHDLGGRAEKRAEC